MVGFLWLTIGNPLDGLPVPLQRLELQRGCSRTVIALLQPRLYIKLRMLHFHDTCRD